MSDHRKILLYILASDIFAMVGTLFMIIAILIPELDFVFKTMFLISILLGMRLIATIRAIDPTHDVWSFHKHQLRSIPAKYDRSTIFVFLSANVIFIIGAFNQISSANLDYFEKASIMAFTFLLMYNIIRICLVVDDVLTD